MLNKMSFGFVLLFSISCARNTIPLTQQINVEVRVLLGMNKSFKIAPSGTYIITVNGQSSVGCSGLEIKYHKQGMLLNNQLIKTSGIKVEGTKAFKVNGVAYRGSFIVYREKTSLMIVNYVGLEEYLLSVVPSEVYRSWDIEALKAQAVAARTYALYEIRRSQTNPKRKFDLYADTRSQVYRGIVSEYSKTSKAVILTLGQVITYQGQLIKSYFSSSIGGYSASGQEIGDNKPYLKPVKSYVSRQNPYAKWAVQVPLVKLQQVYKTSSIASVAVQSRTSSGRIDSVRIQDKNGRIKTVNGCDFRTKIGNSKMKSTLARLKIAQSGNLIIEGMGYGHGVGMGQWEAQELARRGARYSQILPHFYQGTKIMKIY